ncbi:MAG TPA: BTAD domain-containing putative transcriptional regulator [Gemmatimonadales bacterium]|nr:BTAD domain-containing putative transcriptional regulator [Gemmatimonadales bacterium]
MYLTTLGRLQLADAAGREEPSLASRRKKLAVLAVLALADRPLSRAALLEMFWGDSDEARARHSLNDTLSHLRRVLGRDAITGRQAEVALAPDAPLVVDARVFAAAARAGDHARALAAYGGAFLPGVYVEGSVSFERWVDGERRELEGLHLTSCAARARELAAAEAWGEYEVVARRWLAADPCSERAALHLLRALSGPETAGARRRALAAYDEWAAHYERECDRPPPTEVQALARTIAASVPIDGVTAEMPLVAESPVAESPVVESPVVEPPVVERPAGRRGPRDERRLQRRARWSLAAIVAALLAGGLWLRPSEGALPAEAAAAAERPGVAIVAIAAPGADSATQWLDAGLPRMISDQLARVPDVEVIPPERLQLLHGAAGSFDLPALAFLGRRAGASWVAAGLIGRNADGLRLDLSVLDARSGQVARTLTLEAANPLALADQAAAGLLSVVGAHGSGARLVDLETASVQAYEHFVRAQAAAAAGDDASTRRELDAALALDSNFVSALHARYVLAVMHDEREVADRHLAPRLERVRDRMNERDRLEAQVWEAFYAGEHARSEFVARTLAERYPRDPRGRDLLTRIYVLHGRFGAAESLLVAQLAATDTAAGAARTGCTACQLWRTLASVRGQRGDAAGAEAAARRAIALQPQAEAGWRELMGALAMQGRFAAALDAARQAALLAGDTARHTLDEGRLLLAARRFAEADTAIAALSRSADAERRADARDLQILLARERGQFRAARRAVERWEAEAPDQVWIRLMNFDHLGRLGAWSELTRYAAQPAHGWEDVRTRTSPLQGVGFRARGFAWHHAVEADAYAGSGDTLRLRLLADSLERVGGLSYYARDWRTHRHVRGLVHARAGRWADAAREFEAALWGPNGWTRTNLELATAYEHLGRWADAERVLRAAYGASLDGMGRYVPHSELDWRLARLFQRTGRRDSAAAYAAYARAAWRTADPEVRRRLEGLP